jgi:hypothetical protein
LTGQQQPALEEDFAPDPGVPKQVQNPAKMARVILGSDGWPND